MSARVTGIGSWPGTSRGQAVADVVGVLGELPFLPQLPAVADMITEATAESSPWVVPEAPLAAELTVCLCGPATLAAVLEVPTGEAVALLDARLSRWLPALRRDLPGTRVRLQLDEPALATVRDAAATAAVLARHDGPTVVHCCATTPPWDALLSTGADALAVDVTGLDAAGAADLSTVRREREVWLGCMPTIGPVEVRLPPGCALDGATLTPACGLGRSPDAVARLRALVAFSRSVTSD